MATASTTQVLEFDLGTERYCVDIELVSQIVNRQSVTPLPDAPDHVEGVTDLRGETTTIINPKKLLDIEGDVEEDHIVVFDTDQIAAESVMGWEIDTVHRVLDVTPDDIEQSPVAGQECVRGLIDSDDGFIIWVSPDMEEDG